MTRSRSRCWGRRGLIGSLSPGPFSPGALATVMGLARQFDALVFDGDTLTDAAERLLLTTKGFVSDDIPDAWQIPAPPPRRAR